MKPLVDMNRVLVCVRPKEIRSEASVKQLYYLLTTSFPFILVTGRILLLAALPVFESGY